MEKLDVLDRKILFELNLDSRKSSSLIGKAIGGSKETVNYRINRLVKNGYIEQFVTLINPSKLGLTSYVIFLNFNQISLDDEARLIDYLRNDPSCYSLRRTEGQYDLIVVSMHDSPSMLRTFLGNFFNLFGKFISNRHIETITKAHKLNFCEFFVCNAEKISFDMVNQERVAIDQKDKEIIRELCRNSRIQLTSLSASFKMNIHTLRYRIKRFQNLGIFVLYTVVLNLDKIDYNNHHINISMKNPALLYGIIEYFNQTNCGVFAYETLGKYDLIIELYTKDNKKLKRVIEGFRNRFGEYCVSYEVNQVVSEYPMNFAPFMVQTQMN